MALPKRIVSLRPFLTAQKLVPVAAVFALIGTIVLIRSFAAINGVVPFEGEGTTPVGNARVVTSDSSASGGGYIEYGLPTTPTPTPNPNPTPPSTLPGGGWYDITGDKFETTRWTMKSGTHTIYRPISIEKYSANQFPTDIASGVVSFIDKVNNHDFMAKPEASLAGGILMAKFDNGSQYEKGGVGFSGTQASGDCVGSNFSGGMINYRLTACKDHGALKITRNSKTLGEEDKIYTPGPQTESTFAIVNGTGAITGFDALVNAWRASDQDCSGRHGYRVGDAQSIRCMIPLVGGNEGTIWYKDHIIVGFYNNSTGDGMGFVYPKAYTQFTSDVLKGLNPFFPVRNIIAWEYLVDDGGALDRYVFPLHDGKAELESVGKGILDGGYF